MSDRLTRRGAVATIGGMAALAAGACANSRRGLGAVTLLQPQELGWDAQRGEYTLPPLPYAPNALEPHIDEQTMNIHHDRHHQGYVNGLNNALKKLSEMSGSESDAGLLDHWTHELSFNGGGHVNHTLFWRNMAPPGEGGGGEPEGPLREAIDRDFGGFDAFTWLFKNTAGKVKGSGWGWLCHEPIADRLIVTHMHNQQDGLFAGLNPLLGVDVWEHAYYLNYQNRRGEYIDNFMQVVNWPHVAELYQRSRGQ